MKRRTVSRAGLVLAIIGITLGATLAQESEKGGGETKPLGPWGKPENPEGDCRFEINDERLVVTVPGGPVPHDLSAELGNMNGPRVLREIEGDFTIEVCVDGEFNPGGESSQQGRTGYTGAGILVMADDENYVRLERATLQAGSGPARPYANYEIRIDGRCQRFGTTGDARIEAGRPTWLRVQRQGDLMKGSVSHDGKTWQDLEPKELPANWPNKLRIGVGAVSTSKTDFTPAFSGLAVEGAE